jgi:hypothetical protein
MTTKTKTVDWGGLTLDVATLRTGATEPGTVGTAITATAAEINLAADISGRAPVAIPVGTSYAVLATNSGLLHVVPDVSSNITVTLPAASAGLEYEFIYGGAAADAQNHIFVPTAGFFIGGVTFHDAQADATTSVWSDGNSNDVFTLVTPGTYRVKFVCNGTNWYVTGEITGATVCTMAD